jgi:hypothetical protein
MLCWCPTEQKLIKNFETGRLLWNGFHGRCLIPKKSIKNVRKYCDSCQYKNFGTQWELSQCPKILIVSETKSSFVQVVWKAHMLYASILLVMHIICDLFIRGMNQFAANTCHLSVCRSHSSILMRDKSSGPDGSQSLYNEQMEIVSESATCW